MGEKTPMSKNQMAGLYLKGLLADWDTELEDVNLQLTGSKQAGWANTTKQKRSLGEDFRRRADEPILLPGSANILNVCEDPALNADSDKARDCGGDDLSEEHDSGWDLHVMTKFQVSREVEGLFRHDGAVNLEDHNGDGLPGNDVAGDELGENVESQLLVGDRTEDAEWEGEDQGDDYGEKESPEWHLRVVNLDGNHSEDEGCYENCTEPPIGDGTVASHEARVNVLLFLDAGAKLLHNVTSVPQVGVGDDGSESSKTQAVVDGKCCGHEDGGVVTVLLHIEKTIRNDLETVVRGTGIGVGLRGDDGEVCRVPSVREVEDRGDEPEPERERHHGVPLGPPLKRRSEAGSQE